jgi:hypothetical protein
MLRVRFLRTDDKTVQLIGPLPFLRISGGWLRTEAEGSGLAEYRNGFWRVASQDALKLNVSGSGPLLLEADRPEEPVLLGRYAALEFVDGALYSKPDNTLLARFDESAAAWYFYADKRFHSSLFLVESSSPGRPSEGRASAPLHSQH